MKEAMLMEKSKDKVDNANITLVTLPRAPILKKRTELE